VPPAPTVSRGTVTVDLTLSLLSPSAQPASLKPHEGVSTVAVPHEEGLRIVHKRGKVLPYHNTAATRIVRCHRSSLRTSLLN
jgi:hypothetical protein